MIVNECGIEKEEPEDIEQNIIDAFLQNNQNIDQSNSSPAMCLVNALTQQIVDLQDNTIALLQQLGSGATGEFLDIQAMYRGFKRKGGSYTLIVFTITTTGSGTIYCETTTDHIGMIVSDNYGNNYVPVSDFVCSEAGSYEV